MEDDKFPHLGGDKAFSLGVGFSLEEFVAGGLGGEGEGGEGIHDEVDPQHLDGIEGRFPQDGSSHEGHHQGHKVDGQLELQELSDRVKDVPSPFHSSHN